MRSGCSLAGELGWLSSQETPPRGVGLGGARDRARGTSGATSTCP